MLCVIIWQNKILIILQASKKLFSVPVCDTHNLNPPLQRHTVFLDLRFKTPDTDCLHSCLVPSCLYKRPESKTWFRSNSRNPPTFTTRGSLGLTNTGRLASYTPKSLHTNRDGGVSL